MPTRPEAARRYTPLAPAAAAFVLGILVGEYLGGGMVLWCALGLVAATLWGLLRVYRAGEGGLLVPLVVLLAAAGAARYRASVDPPPDDVARLAPDGRRLVRLEGVVVRSPCQMPPPADVFLPSRPYHVRTKLAIDAHRAKVGDRWVPAHGRVQVSVREPLPDDGRSVPDLGDRVCVVGWLMRPGGMSNPGGFDVATYFRRQGVRARFYTDHWEAMDVVERAADPLRWAVGAVGRLALRRFEGIRNKESRAVAAAIVLGRRDLLAFDAGEAAANDIERAFIVTGTAHFLAVSGFNVGLAAAVVLLVTRLVGLGPRPTAVLVALVVLAYAMATELRPPVVRAAILVWILCLAWMLGREQSRLNSLAAAVLVILLIRPGDLFTTSFQLSFAVVLGMFWLVGKVERTLRWHGADEALLEPPGREFDLPWRRYLRQTIALSISASLVAVPLVAYRFHLLGWLAPIASIALAPLIFGLVAGSMALVVIEVPVPWLVDLLAAVPDGMARAVVGVVTALSRVPGSHIYTPDVSWVVLVVAYGLLATWTWRERLGVSRRRLAMAALAAAAAFLWTGGHRPPAHVRATFLAVGSGNTTLLELPNGRNLLYDAGSSLTYARAAEGTIAPALWSRGVERLDAVLISHAHFDHFKDLLPLVDRFGVRQVFVPPTFLRRRLETDDKVVKELWARGVRVGCFGAGDRLVGTGEVQMRAVWPRGSASMTKRINDGSLVVALAEGGRRLLLTGDIERPGIEGLLAEEPDLRADAMLWPHHGQEPKAVGDLARQTGARTLVISSGRPRRPRPPPPWVGELGVATYCTGEVGAVTLELRPEGVRVGTFCPLPSAPDDEWPADETEEASYEQ